MWRCPKCSSDQLRVAVTIAAALHQTPDGYFETEAAGDHEWDGTSIMFCSLCSHYGVADNFRIKENTMKTEIMVDQSQALPFLIKVLNADEPVFLIAGQSSSHGLEFEIHIDGQQTSHVLRLYDSTWRVMTEVEI